MIHASHAACSPALSAPRSVAPPSAGRWLGWLLFGSVWLAGSGCVAVVPYDGRTTLVKEQGFQDVRRILSEVATRALNPHITTVDVTEEFFFYGWTETFLGPFYVPVTSSHQNQVYYANIGRLELYENFNVFVWGPGDHRVDKILFGGLEDAKAFIDCLASLKAARSR